MANFLKALNHTRKPSERFNNWKELRAAQSSPELGYYDWKNMKRDMQNFFKYVRKMMDDNPELTNEEICKSINDFLNDTKVRICSSSGVRSNGIRLDLMGYFKADKSRLMKAYDDCILRERRR